MSDVARDRLSALPAQSQCKLLGANGHRLYGLESPG